MKSDKKKRGFTLVELLTVIIVLGIVMSITIVFVSNLRNSSETNIDEMTKGLVMDSVKSYSTEFKSGMDWKQEESTVVNPDGTKDRVVSYCVSIESLINSGYFKGDNDRINNLRDNYVALVTEKNGTVSDVEFIEKGSLTEEVNKTNKCQYVKKEYSSSGNFSGEHSIKYKIDGADVEVARIKYVFKRIDDYTYDVDFTLTNTLDIGNIPINKGVDLLMLLDYSGSMEGSAYSSAKYATQSLSDTFIKTVKNSRVGLIGFATSGKILRELDNSNFDDVVFPSAYGVTNVNNAIDEAIYLFNKSNSDNNLKYVLLLYDGYPNYVSYYNMNGKRMYPNSKEYFDNYRDYGRGKLINSGNYSFSYLKFASDYLKSSEGGDATLITVGYGFTGNSSLKEISSKSDVICSDNDYKAKASQNYCYFTSDSGNVLNVFSKIGDAIRADVLDRLAREVGVETTLNTNLSINGRSDNVINYNIKLSNNETGTEQKEHLTLNVDPKLLQETGEATIDLFKSIDISFIDKDGNASQSYRIEDDFPQITFKRSIVSKLN